MTVKEIFEQAENGTLTWEQFQAAMGTAKFVDLSEGNYVSKRKYDDDIEAKNTQIATLDGTLKERNKDLAGLKSQLEEAGTDAEKLTQLTGEFDTLKNKYDNDTKAFRAQLKKQAYEFAVKEYAGTLKFTSEAAKRDFTRAMIEKDLKMENDMILGKDDFTTAYSANNADAFIVEEPQQQEPQQQQNNKPQFVNQTQGNEPPQADQNAFLNAFNFTGVRPMQQK